VKYLLDTNTLIYFFKNQGRVAEALLACNSKEVGIASLVYYELKVGIAKSQSPQKRLEQLNALVDQINVLPFSIKEADAAALIRANLEQKGLPIGPLDTLIAATAVTHQCTLITHNTAEFSRVSGLQLQDWY
jgi:tRNA(fMet)-specific endonuclease VapC